MQLVYKAANITEAEIVKGMLDANGLHAHVGGYYLQGGVGEMSTMDFANVHVPENEITQARELIDSYESAGSGRQDPSGTAKRRATPAPVILVLAALALTFFLYFVAISH